MAFPAAIMTAYHVSARATRDALFLSRFELAWLPWMAAIASALSIAVALDVGRRMHAAAPGRLVTMAFAGSAVLSLVEWWLLQRVPGAGTVAFYLHVSVLGPVLVSGFWLLVSEDLDPRTTRRMLGRLSALATLGGLVGFLVVDRMTAWFGLAAVLPFLALVHAGVGWSLWRHASERSRRPEPTPSSADVPPARWFERAFASPHRRVLALIVFGSSIAASLVDFVFKAFADTAPNDLVLVRLFLGINIIPILGTVVLQTLFGRLRPGRTFFVRTVGSVPVTVLLGSVAAIVVTAPWFVAVVRAAEAILRGSWFRSGYELLYAGIRREERRTVRTVIDVACDRLGDITAAGIIAFVLAFLPVGTLGILLFLSAAIAAFTLVLVPHLDKGHRRELEESIRVHGRAAEPSVPALSSLRFAFGGLDGEDPATGRTRDQAPVPPDEPRTGTAGAGRPPVHPSTTELDDVLVPQAIAALGDSERAGSARARLVAVAGRHIGQLVDALLDSRSNAALRGHVADILGICADPRAVDGLCRGLADPYLDVRRACARSLLRLVRRDAELNVDRERVFEAIRREATFLRQDRATRGIGGEHRDDNLDAFLRQRADQTLEYVFLLLAMQLPGEATERALGDLRGDDRIRRGTALEYLEGVLPPNVRDAVWSMLEAPSPSTDATRERGPDY